MQRNANSGEGEWVIFVPGDTRTYPPPKKRIEAIFQPEALYEGAPRLHAYARRCSSSYVEALLYGVKVDMYEIIAWRRVDAR